MNADRSIRNVAIDYYGSFRSIHISRADRLTAHYEPTQSSVRRVTQYILTHDTRMIGPYRTTDTREELSKMQAASGEPVRGQPGAASPEQLDRVRADADSSGTGS